ncbi:MAG: hypothetical protein JO107_16295 [Hyphomicrobiales bacterium]|nr:hypothetical protein [Hyphomicrobiales bacterium]
MTDRITSDELNRLERIAKSPSGEVTPEDALRLIAAAREAEVLRAENARLHERLEDNHVFDSEGQRFDVVPGTIPDGIAARDETIKILDKNIDTLRAAREKANAEIATLRAALKDAEAALEPWAKFADALNEQVPGDIAIGIFCDGAMRFGPSGAQDVNDLRRARDAHETIKGVMA